MDTKTISIIEKNINYIFKNKDLLEQAFTRRSWSEENGRLADNEILEFIGDKALDFVIVKLLIERYGKICDIPILAETEKTVVRCAHIFDTDEYDEGRLSRIKANLVCSKSLSSAMDELGIAGYLKMSRGDEKSGVINEPHVKEDLFEAVIGAIAIDSRWDLAAIEEAIEHMLKPTEKLDNGLNDDDYIGLVQSWYQKRNGGTLPEYEIAGSESGFKAKVNIHPEYSDEYVHFCNMETVFIGYGRSKEAARSDAARKAWKNISSEQASRTSFKDLVGVPDKERAINQLQELWQKGYIEKPEYRFTKKTDINNGQDVWLCECIFGDFPAICVESTNKIESKKDVAYITALELSREFYKYSKKEIR